MNNLAEDVAAKIVALLEIGDIFSVALIKGSFHDAALKSIETVRKTLEKLLLPPFNLRLRKGLSLTNLKLCSKNKRSAVQFIEKFVSVVAVGSLANLKYLDLGDNKIGDDGISAFCEAMVRGILANLKGLSVGGNQIGDIGMEELSLALVFSALASGEKNSPELWRVSRLNYIGHMRLNHINAMQEVFWTLASDESLGAPVSLKKLYLYNNLIGDVGVTAIAGAIATGLLANLSQLTLGRNRIGDVGMRAFSDAIANGSLENLTLLCLGSNQINDDGMIAFSDAIKRVPENPMGSLANLKKLYLGVNDIRDDGIGAFSDAIASGSLPNLEKLNLYENRIGDVGMQAFASAIVSGWLTNLSDLMLDRNQIREVGIKAFSDAIASGSLASLKNVHLSYYVTDPALKAVFKRRCITVHYSTPVSGAQAL